MLVVDDSRAMRGMISGIIHGRFLADITECSSGLEALKVIPNQRFDIVITDINMPDINGFELIQFLRSNDRFADLPLVVITTESAPEKRQRALSAGADAYLTKPFRPEQLIEILERLSPVTEET
ncbi:MAG: response regulator [Candidatus Dadabacteria bacterium]|nr:MAG: response regulator [Candidatus Dadabacteria bacterium]